jgi:plasmid maintenance system antidote protein VapI
MMVMADTSAESWLSMQANFDLWKERQKNSVSVKEFPKMAV